MKRRAFQLLLLLILGAIVNVALAWGYVGLNAGHLQKEMTVADIIVHLRSTYTDGRPVAGKFSHKQTGLLFAYLSEVHEQRPENNNANNRWTAHWRVGWPARTLTRSFSEKPSIGQTPLGNLPFLLKTPLWPGFAINTIFYAAILWVVFFVPGMVRRRIRRRRRLCPTCAYPVGTSRVCTECGKPMVKIKSELHGTR